MEKFDLTWYDTRLKEDHPEFRIRLLLELRVNHPEILKLEVPTVEVPHHTIKHIDSYTAPVNKMIGKPFPNCCEFHKTILKEMEGWFEMFPDCCSDHQKLKDAPWFSAKRYSAVAEKVVRQVVFTEYHILRCINSSSWYEEIVNYFELNVISFGQLPHGFGNPIGLEHYLRYLKLALKEGGSCLKTNTICKEKIKRMVQFFNSYHPDLKVQNEIVLNLLSIYRKWFRTFPFKTKYFREDYYEYDRWFPIQGEERYNPYLESIMSPLRTEMDLTEFLVSKTKELLSQINTKELIESGDLGSFRKHLLELKSEKYRIKRAALLEEYSSKEMEYVKMVKKWLKNEIEYFDNIAPFINFKNKYSDLWYKEAVRQGVSADILKEVSELFSVDEHAEVEMAVRYGLGGKRKYYEGYAKKISIKQFALCHHFLKEANIIEDDISNGHQYGTAFKTYSTQTKKINQNSFNLHKNAYYYVGELTTDKELTHHNMLNLEVVKRVFISNPIVQCLIMELADSLSEKKVLHNDPPGRR